MDHDPSRLSHRCKGPVLTDHALQHALRNLWRGHQHVAEVLVRSGRRQVVDELFGVLATFAKHPEDNPLQLFNMKGAV